MNIKDILFQDQADDTPHEEKNETAINYNVDNKQDEIIALRALDYVNLAGVLLTMICGVIAAFNLSRGFLCATVVFLVCTVYTIFFRLHKLEQFRKKWSKPIEQEQKSPMDEVSAKFAQLGNSFKLK